MLNKKQNKSSIYINTNNTYIEDDDILEIPKESSSSLLLNKKQNKTPISPPNWVELSKNLHAVSKDLSKKSNTVELSSIESKGGKNIQNKILTKSPNKCPKGKVLNPKTGRYILIKNALNKNGVKTKSPKNCPKGKVLNPKTGRYVLIKNALNKNGVKTKSLEKCPKGKVLNPKTGRYILLR